MNQASELVSGILLAAILLVLAGYFVWRQRQATKALRTQDPLSPEDRRYHRNQGRRRLACAVLMVLCAGMIVAWFPLEDTLNQAPEPLVFYWVTVLLLVMAIILLAAFDFWAIARFGLRHARQLQADRRDMLERQVARYRSQRNGHH